MWRGYWGKILAISTLPIQGNRLLWLFLCSSALFPTARDTGIVSAPVPKQPLLMAGLNDCSTSARGCTAILGNFAKATFYDTSKTSSFLIPNVWKETVFTKSPCQEFIGQLVKTHNRVTV